MIEYIVIQRSAVREDIISSNTRVITNAHKSQGKQVQYSHNFNIPDYNIFPYSQNVDNVFLHRYKS